MESLSTSVLALFLALLFGALWGFLFWTPVTVVLIIYWYRKIEAPGLAPSNGDGKRTRGGSPGWYPLGLSIAGVVLMAIATMIVPGLFLAGADPNCGPGIPCPSVAAEIPEFLGFALPLPTALASLGGVPPLSKKLPFASAIITAMLGVWQYVATSNEISLYSGELFSPPLNVLREHILLGLIFLLSAAFVVALGGVIALRTSRPKETAAIGG